MLFHLLFLKISETNLLIDYMFIEISMKMFLDENKFPLFDV